MLKTSVNSGSIFESIIDLPPNLGKRNLKLFIQGKAVFTEATHPLNSPKQVSLRFENNYRIGSAV